MDEVGSPGEQAEHAAGIVGVDRLLQDESVDIDGGVGGDDDHVGPDPLATDAAFSADNRATYPEGVSPGCTDSSMSAGITSNSSPTERSSSDRRGDAEANTSRTPSGNSIISRPTVP